MGLDVLDIDADLHAEGFYRHLGAQLVGQVASGSIAGPADPSAQLAVPA